MKIVAAMLIIGLILLVCLIKGLNGVLMSSGIGLVSGLAGYGAGRKTRTK